MNNQIFEINTYFKKFLNYINKYLLKNVYITNYNKFFIA